MKKNYRGFTLIELLVVAVIFTIVFLITMAFVNLASGSVKSSRTKMLTNEMRNVMDTISQKLNNANSIQVMHLIGGTDTLNVYGFNTYTYNAGPYLGLESLFVCTGALTPHSIMCDEIFWKNEALWYPPNIRLTSDKIKVTKFDLDFTEGDTDETPYLKITIEAKDADPKYGNDNTIKIETAYTIDYATWKNIHP